MTTLEISFDAQTLNDNVFHDILRDGILLRACGLINLRWDDFSAQRLFSSLGLSDVIWETTRDDTPGTLTCLVFYAGKTQEEIGARLQNNAINDYDLS